MMAPAFATALHALTVEVEGSVFVVDLRDGTSVALNGAAATIWRGLVRLQPPQQIAAALAAAFGIDERRAHADVSAFLATLIERGLVDMRDGAATSTAVSRD